MRGNWIKGASISQLTTHSRFKFSLGSVVQPIFLGPWLFSRRELLNLPFGKFRLLALPGLLANPCVLTGGLIWSSIRNLLKDEFVRGVKMKLSGNWRKGIVLPVILLTTALIVGVGCGGEEEGGQPPTPTPTATTSPATSEPRLNWN